jgi:hypothetical protein
MEARTRKRAQKAKRTARAVAGGSDMCKYMERKYNQAAFQAESRLFY